MRHKQKSYKGRGKGSNPASFNNKPTKTASQMRKRLPIVKDTELSVLLDKAMEKVPPRQKSKYITNLLLKAIDEDRSNLYPKDLDTQDLHSWQISMQPDEYEKVRSWCDANLNRQTSRWVAQVILDAQPLESGIKVRY